MDKFIFAPLILLLSLFLLFPFEAIGQTKDSTLVLDKLVQKVLTQNPELQSSFQGWEASKTRISQQEALPDPTLGLNMMNLPVNSFALDQESILLLW